jgi:tetratricopeptide (TPR) repeat protein
LSNNPESARALAASGYIKASFDYDWVGANEDLERAVSLEPGYATGHQWYGEVLNHQRRLDDALFQLEIARQADPMSVVVRHVPGYFNLWALRFDEAEVHYRDTLELGPPMRWTLHNLDFLNTMRGDYDEARHYARALARLENFDPAADLARIDAIENPALQERALRMLAERQDMADGVFGKALQYAVLGENELALASLEAGFAAGDPYSASMNYIKLYDPLRSEPRFQEMLRTMNFIE